MRLDLAGMNTGADLDTDPDERVTQPDATGDALRGRVSKVTSNPSPVLFTITTQSGVSRGGTMTFDIDLFVDLNTEDGSGLPWTFLDEARDPNAIVGAGSVSAVAQVVDVADDGVVHVRPVPGSVTANAHLLGDRGVA